MLAVPVGAPIKQKTWLPMATVTRLRTKIISMNLSSKRVNLFQQILELDSSCSYSDALAAAEASNIFSIIIIYYNVVK